MNKDNTFAIAEVMPGKLNALVKNIMRQTGTDDPNEAVRKVNSGEWTVTKRLRLFRMAHGVIFFTLPPTDGTTGPQWIERLEKKGIQSGKWAKDVLNSPDFKPTTGVVNNVAVLKGDLFTDNDRTTSEIHTEADKRKLLRPNAEIACWIREIFTEKEIEEMGLIHIIAMHSPIDSGDGARVLVTHHYCDDEPWLGTGICDPSSGWERELGFAFVIPQVALNPELFRSPEIRSPEIFT